MMFFKRLWPSENCGQRPLGGGIPVDGFQTACLPCGQRAGFPVCLLYLRQLPVHGEKGGRQIGVVGKFRPFVSGVVIEDFAQQGVVDGVAGFVALERADEGVAGDVEVADGVEDFVADEFVGGSAALRG